MNLRGTIVVVNCGSSSVRVALFDATGAHRVWTAHAERVGGRDGTLTIKELAQVRAQPLVVPDQNAALRAILNRLVQIGDGSPRAVGHRVVHGGQNFGTPQPITIGVEQELNTLIPFAPLHLPANLRGIASVRSVWPDIPQVACFDTMFHTTLPPAARELALPREISGSELRRYGFHGLSYEYILGALAEAEVDLLTERIVIAHLGSGASMCAIKEGKSVETTMGFSPLSGLPMSSRCGDIDPGALLHLLTEKRLDPDELQDMLYRRSGLAALSEGSGDMQDLLERQATDAAAASAVEFFCYHARRHIGALAAVLGGIDRLVFTGGIGANAPDIRGKICNGLEFLGLALDRAHNETSRRRFSTSDSAVIVEAMPTDEELVIARHVLRTLTLA